MSQSCRQAYAADSSQPSHRYSFGHGKLYSATACGFPATDVVAIIKGVIAAREKIIAIEPCRDKDGIGRCRLVMQPKVIAVSPRPMRPFQGWRYLTEDAVPADLTKSSAASVAAMPEPMRRELRDLIGQCQKGAISECRIIGALSPR